MLLGGLWHGANWTFVVWGGIHGAWLGLERFISGKGSDADRQTAWGRWMRRLVIFHLVGIGWVFFRATSVGAAFHMLGGLGTWYWRPEYWTAFKFLAVFIIPLTLIDLQMEKTGGETVFQFRPLQSASSTPTNYYSSMEPGLSEYSGNNGGLFWHALIEKEKNEAQRFIAESENISWVVAFASLGIFNIIGVIKNCANATEF